MGPHQEKNAHPSHSDRQLREITKVQIFSLRNERFELHISPSILHRRSEPLEYLTLKTNGKYTKENYRTAGNRNPLSKSSRAG